MRLFYASDLHGSEPCFRKFINAAAFYDVQALILGGDLAGKAILPIVEQAAGKYNTKFLGREMVLEDIESVENLEKRARAHGLYPKRVSPGEARILAEDANARDRAFEMATIAFFESWLSFAEERLPRDVECYVIAGNDDFPAILSALKAGVRVRYVEGEKVTVADKYEMISIGYSNRTPFNSPREVDDSELGRMVETLAEQIVKRDDAIFNLHCPPYGTTLDLAPEIDEQFRVKMQLGHAHMMHVGSIGIRDAIERYQPMLGLHGHCHESRGADRIGRTICLNPGSEYANGVLRGAIISIFDKGKAPQHQFVAA